MIAVCWKWVAGSDGDVRWAGVSDADRAALEVGLALADTTADTVTVVMLGGTGAETGLRAALAAGAARAVRVDASPALPSGVVAAALADVVAGAAWVVCGDISSDRGSGSVPAFLAAELDAAQALGLIAVDTSAVPVQVVRRLDGGRREVLAVAAPAVLSVEGAVAHLRRAGLPAELRARTAPIEVVAGPVASPERAELIQPYRPRARVLPAPSGIALARVLQLTGASGPAAPARELVTLEPAGAAERILGALVEWGYELPALTTPAS